ALATLAGGQGDYPGALQHASQALGLASDAAMRGKVHLLRAWIFHQLGDPAAKRQEYEAALAADPDSADARHKIGFYLWQAGEFQLAVHHLQRAVELAPDNYDAWEALWRAASDAGDLLLAQQVLERALALGHDRPELRLDLGWVLNHLGNS